MSEERDVRSWVKDEMGRHLETLQATDKQLAKRLNDTVALVEQQQPDGDERIRLSLIRWGGALMVACCLAIATCTTVGSFAPPAPQAVSKVEQCAKACNGSMAKWGDGYTYDGKVQPETCECKSGEHPIAKQVEAPLHLNDQAPSYHGGGIILNTDPRSGIVSSDRILGSDYFTADQWTAGRSYSVMCGVDGSCKLMETK